MEFNELTQKVIEWAYDKGIIKPENQHKQMIKCVEEVGELAKALLKNDKAGVIDGIGDVTVTLIILSRQLGLDFETCLNAAYEEIKDRTGRNENGIFIKD